MEYIGIEKQRQRNNMRSLCMLVLFPCLMTGLVYLACFILIKSIAWTTNDEQQSAYSSYQSINMLFVTVLPYVLGGVALWFIIAWFSHTAIIKHATGSQPLARQENKRVYNLVENLCMSQGMSMPSVNVINDDSLNAFASGINRRTYAVTLTTGIINKLDDEELEAVIAHELTHIRNRDVRVLIISIVFVGILSALAQNGFRILRHMPLGGDRKKNGGGIFFIILIVAIVAAIGYLFASLMRFAISKQREYMADAGSAQMTRRPWALASALRKISQDPLVEAIERKDVAQLFIEDPKDASLRSGNLFGLFSTHPPIIRRIAILEQF
ncbi:MAG: M48 family metallopeptidase [Tannerellaceae bacterium]|nr:M48 family metallopeptidase [Tannerellaceae bacterium]